MQNKKAQNAKKAKQKTKSKNAPQKRGSRKRAKQKTQNKTHAKAKKPLLALNLSYCLISFKSFKFSTYTLKLGKAKPSPFFSKIRIKSSISFWRASLNSPALMTLV